MLSLNIVGDPTAEVDYERLQRVVAILNDQASELGLPEGELNLRFINDEEIRELNQRFAGNDYSTDVLSFSYIEDDVVPPAEIGDIAVSLETAKRQAEKSDTKLADEVALLTLHGILHICGYDHVDVEDIDRLDKVQAQVMQAAGMPYREFLWES